jgi:hypothetical protein
VCSSDLDVATLAEVLEARPEDVEVTLQALVETYLTGEYEVRETGSSPCYVGQYWSDCINLFVSYYNAVCVGVSLTTAGNRLCESYLAMIDGMKSRGGAWSTVSSLGDWGPLTREAATATRRVSNNDYRPAVTREAVCYWGFLGECR